MTLTSSVGLEVRHGQEVEAAAWNATRVASIYSASERTHHALLMTEPLMLGKTLSKFLPYFTEVFGFPDRVIRHCVIKMPIFHSAFEKDPPWIEMSSF